MHERDLTCAVRLQRLFLPSESDKVFFGTLAGVVAELFVIDFQIRHRAAGSTLPAIPTQHNLPQTVVRPGIQP